MSKSELYRDFDFWDFGFLVVADLVLFLGVGLGEDDGSVFLDWLRTTTKDG
jgi:hypothetical protein